MQNSLKTDRPRDKTKLTYSSNTDNVMTYVTLKTM